MTVSDDESRAALATATADALMRRGRLRSELAAARGNLRNVDAAIEVALAIAKTDVSVGALLIDSYGMREGVRLIALERERQAEKWSATHDDGHTHGELAVRAAELAVDGTDEEISTHYHHPADSWGLVEKHERERVRQLAVAGALIAAEIERVIRRDGGQGG